ncbi:uncharacterized protein LOC114515854 [Dendronephthya gigantea]|uniref:uncharacterized protein LOC114515854 n=1 Tax=Dendronephthya gigantea TaxID=151771 RepID=UPI001069622A|nr:uncharacterized protein LOC114515854 [Dendronephthya gigantea]
MFKIITLLSLILQVAYIIPQNCSPVIYTIIATGGLSLSPDETISNHTIKRGIVSLECHEHCQKEPGCVGFNYRDKMNVVNCQLTNITEKTNHTSMTEEREWILMRDDEAVKKRNDILNSATSCAHLYNKGVRKDGVYTIDPDGLGSFQVSCDMNTNGNGWTVFQRRQDGSQDFLLGWPEYKKGFGNLSGEFWLGLDKIHRLSKSGQDAVLRIDLMDFNSTGRYAKYGKFTVADKSDKYRLNIGNYSGDAGDSLAYHNKMQFTTKDSDNDPRSNGNCAITFRGAWWYNDCHRSNLNGVYLHGAGGLSLSPDEIISNHTIKHGIVPIECYELCQKEPGCVGYNYRDKINVVNCQLTNIIEKREQTSMKGEGEWILMLDNKLEKRRNDILNSAIGCAYLYNKGVRKDGVYKINPDGLGSFKVRCDMSTDGGGWTVFQRRQDGSQDFYLGWSDYKVGFGDLSGEFWLGLDKIHRLFKSDQNVLRVDLMDFNGTERYAKYETFSVADESDKFRLNIGNFSGDAGDSLYYHNQMQFTTNDSDNDARSDENCATGFKGAWWYNNCYNSNLNGLYLGAGQYDATGITWLMWRGHYSLKKTEMKIRPNYFSLT